MLAGAFLYDGSMFGLRLKLEHKYKHDKKISVFWSISMLAFSSLSVQIFLIKKKKI